VTYEEASARTVAIVDEHLLGGGADRTRIGEMLRRHTVRLVADERDATSIAGQELLLTTTLLVRRMGMALEMAAPDAPLLASGPPFEGTTLHEVLRSVEHELLPRTHFAIGPSDTVVEIEFVLGASAATGRAERVLRIGAVGAHAVVAPIDEDIDVEAEARLAALAASGVAAAQAFRSFAARLPSEFGDEMAKDFSFEAPCEIDLDEVLGVEVRQLLQPSLGRVDFISAGANHQLLALHISPHGRGASRSGDRAQGARSS
jgi:hypothetical protein